MAARALRTDLAYDHQHQVLGRGAHGQLLQDILILQGLAL